ncbi:SCP2 sterol-binding domain-containing protein [Peribacillus asahii]|uniref:SCP2 sterol-binding domain-containing protein n=1 Tax=Peribacillus asahii TaxID=228899 RepID=UPI001FE37A21|nr:SCP2 sterol-binding domain-containing protein [Peribacillus asahii]
MSILDELNKLAEKLNNSGERTFGNRARVYQFDLEESGSFQLLIKDGKVKVLEGTPYHPEITLQLSDENLFKLLNDDSSTTEALKAGRLKVDGKVDFT